MSSRMRLGAHLSSRYFARSSSVLSSRIRRASYPAGWIESSVGGVSRIHPCTAHILHIHTTFDTPSQNAGLGSTNDRRVAGCCLLLREAIERARRSCLSAPLDP